MVPQTDGNSVITLAGHLRPLKLVIVTMLNVCICFSSVRIALSPNLFWSNRFRISLRDARIGLLRFNPWVMNGSRSNQLDSFLGLMKSRDLLRSHLQSYTRRKRIRLSKDTVSRWQNLSVEKSGIYRRAQGYVDSRHWLTFWQWISRVTKIVLWVPASSVTSERCFWKVGFTGRRTEQNLFTVECRK